MESECIVSSYLRYKNVLTAESNEDNPFQRALCKFSRSAGHSNFLSGFARSQQVSVFTSCVFFCRRKRVKSFPLLSRTDVSSFRNNRTFRDRRHYHTQGARRSLGTLTVC